MRPATLALADVHRATTRVRGRPVEIFLFDHHRTAYTLWCEVARRTGPLALLTLDRHMDLGVPALDAFPPFTAPLAELDAFARHRLAVSNDDHIVAAMQSGAVGDGLVVARSHRPPDLGAFQPFRDLAGRSHHLAFADTVDDVGPSHLAALGQGPLVLDVDLDCFTTLSDGHPDEVLTWDEEQIEAFLLPPDAERLWDAVLPRVQVVTLAREPYHCGGFGRGARLWLAFAEVFFRRVLGVPPP